MTDQFAHPTIKHVIYVMMENRGFDHFMGWLYSTKDEDKGQYKLHSYDNDERAFMGLSDDLIAQLTNPLPNPQLPAQPVIKGARSPKTPSCNPGEHFPHIMNQMWGCGVDHSEWTTPSKRATLLQSKMRNGVAPMNGYILDYARELTHIGIKTPDADRLSEIVETYLPEQLPVLSGLAKSFAVCDEWYCSVPSQTNTNRAFSLTGTSRGMVNNGFYTPSSLNPTKNLIEYFTNLNADSLPVSTGSLFELLQAASYSWKVYWQSEWPPKYMTTGVQWQYTRTLIPALLDSQFNDNFIKFDASKPSNALFDSIAKGDISAFTYIEPKWGGGPSWEAKKRLVGNEYHPVCDTTVAEDFLRKLYQSFINSPRAADTLLIITFDENGGTYDHMVPPEAPPPDNQSVPLPKAWWDNKDLDNAISVSADGCVTDAMTRTQYGFDFKQFGIRVPTILISPNLPANTLFRSNIKGKVFDHTSIIASVLEMAGIKKSRWMLGERVNQAPTFTHLFDGDLAANNIPVKPFSFVGARVIGNNILAKQAYKLAYLGSLWPRAGNPSYLGKPEYSKLYRAFYPKLARQEDAASYMIIPVSNSDGPISNLSKVRICVQSDAVDKAVALLGAGAGNYVYFGAMGKEANDASTWEIRLLGSCDPQDDIQLGDYVTFFSCLPPSYLRQTTELITPDPFQRLMPSRSNPSYLSAMAGDWAIWQVLAN